MLYKITVSLSGSELFHHHRFLTDVLDLLDHVQLFLDVALVGLEEDDVLVDGGVSRLVLASGDVGDLSEFGPVFAFVNLGSAGEDSLDHLHFLCFDYVVLIVSLDYFFEGLDCLTLHQRHQTNIKASLLINFIPNNHIQTIVQPYL